MSRRLLLALLACALCIPGMPAPAQTYEGEVLVNASLVADTTAIVPGKPFTVGVLLKEAPDWHTYWQYPGDAGFPTKIEWTLPPGFKAGPIQWPIPVKENDDGDMQTFIYKDEVMLMVEITPPANLDAKAITLSAKASWLVCKQICVPGNADLSLALPVAAQGGAANGDLFAKYRVLLPIIGDKDFTYKWSNTKDYADLEFHIAHGIDLLAMPDFFPLPPSGVIVEHPAVTLDGHGSLHAIVKLDSGDSKQLSGIVVNGNGASRRGWFVPPQTSALTLASNSSATISVPAASATGSDLLHFLILGFFGGMLLNIMPCVLPVITLKIYGFIHQAGKSRARILHLGLAYCAGVFAWFLGLAALIVVFHFNWSFQFQSKGFVFAMLLLCLVFGLNLIGLFDLVIPGNFNTKLVNAASKEGLGGAFIHGLFTTLMGSACTAPLLGPAVGFALAQPPPVTFSFFATIAAGMSFPYFMLTLNPGWMRFLPRPGMWMVRVRQVMGALVLATAVWFGYILFQQVAVKHEAFAPQFRAALKSGRTVFVDFTADWCINCKVNERLVLNSDTVKDAFKKDDVLLIKADWTNGDADITKLLQQFKRAGVPAYVIYPAGSNQPIVLSELLTTQIVLDGLKQAKEKTK